MTPYSLDHLSPEDFEEFCYDLLKLEGFTNLSWRKGTALGGSSADQGRDIQGQKLRQLLGQRMILETWFFECKHHKTGVPPDKVQGAISWAAAERPDHLVLIASGAFTNGTKNCVREYRRNNRPPFRIDLIERKELQEMFMPHRSLLEKYGVGPPTIAIVLEDRLDQWNDVSLAKVMRVMVDAAKSSRITLAGTGGARDTGIRVDLPTEHAEVLRRVMADESKKEHRGIKPVPELLSRDIDINGTEFPGFACDTRAIDMATMNGLMPTIFGISPVHKKDLSDGQE